MGRVAASEYMDEMAEAMRREWRLSFEDELSRERARWASELVVEVSTVEANAKSLEVQAQARAECAESLLRCCKGELVLMTQRVDDAVDARQLETGAAAEERRRRLDAEASIARLAKELEEARAAYAAEQASLEGTEARWRAAQEEVGVMKADAMGSARTAEWHDDLHAREMKVAHAELAEGRLNSHALAAAGLREIGLEEETARLKIVTNQSQRSARGEYETVEVALAAKGIKLAEARSEIAHLNVQREKLLGALATESAQVAACEEVAAFDSRRRVDAEEVGVDARKRQAAFLDELLGARDAAAEAAEEVASEASVRSADLARFAAELRRCRDEAYSFQRERDLACLRAASARGGSHPFDIDNVGASLAVVGLAGSGTAGIILLPRLGYPAGALAGSLPLTPSPEALIKQYHIRPATAGFGATLSRDDSQNEGDFNDEDIFATIGISELPGALTPPPLCLGDAEGET